jgi:hypothetical protein
MEEYSPAFYGNQDTGFGLGWLFGLGIIPDFGG